MHCVGHAPPPCDLLGAVDAGRIDIALALGADLRSLGDDQSRARALPVVLDREAGGHLPGRSAVTGQRRHDDAVGKVELTDADGVEKGRAHGRLCQETQPPHRPTLHLAARSLRQRYCERITHRTPAARVDVGQRGPQEHPADALVVVSGRLERAKTSSCRQPRGAKVSCRSEPG